MKKTIFFLLLTVVTGSLVSCSKHDKSSLSAKTYVIVPGAWSAPYAWTSVQTDLEKAGNKVVVVQLPGHGTDQTPPQGLTLDTYKNVVINTIDSLGGKVMLVGHSFGGVMLGASLVPSTDGLTLGVVSDKIIPSFIQDGTDAGQNLVVTNFRAEPSIPLTDTVSLTAANYGSVPKVYIRTLMDHAVTPTLQSRMLTATPTFTSILSINASHSPFLVKPDSVAALLTIAAK